MTRPKKAEPVTDAMVRLVAGIARCAEPTARKFLAGEKVRGHELTERLGRAVEQARKLDVEPHAAGVSR